MAFRVMRNKRNQRWTTRLNEIFQEWDKAQNGYITLDTMTEIYRIYKVDLKEEEVKLKLDRNGNIRKNEFIEYSIEVKLLDLTERKSEVTKKPSNQQSTRPHVSPSQGI